MHKKTAGGMRQRTADSQASSGGGWPPHDVCVVCSRRVPNRRAGLRRAQTECELNTNAACTSCVTTACQLTLLNGRSTGCS